MNTIANLLAIDDILVDVDVVDKFDLFENIAQFFEWRHGVSAVLTYKSLLARENLGTTGIGLGVAIPHARIKGLEKTVGVFVRPRPPLDFAAADGKPVSIVLALLVPEHVHREHLEMLAAAAKLFADKAFREQLRASASAQDIYRLFHDGR